MRNRGLLKRVFRQQREAAAIKRARAVQSDFALLSMCMEAWRIVSRSRRKLRGCLAFTRALQSTVQRQSILGHFLRWRSKAEQLTKQVHISRETLKKLVRACFLSWCVFVVHRSKLENVATKRSTLALQRWVFSRIKGYLARKTHAAAQLYTRTLLERTFEAWKYQHPLVAVIQKQREKRDQLAILMIHEWQLLTIKSLRYRRGFDTINSIWLRLRMRQALYVWPGRISFRIADQMRRKLQAAKPKRSRLVDAPISKKLLQGEVQSFIQPRRRNILEKAMEYGFIVDYTEEEKIIRLFDVIRAVFDGWRIHINKTMDLKRRARIVAVRHNKGVQRIAMLNWMYLTPRISHRVIVWTLPRYPLRIARKSVGETQQRHVEENEKSNSVSFESTYC